MAQIDVKNVTLAYESLTVTENLSFSVNEGEYLCIVGENGSGKSTLVKAILSLKSVKSGEIVFSDGLAANQIGYLPQHSAQKADFPATVYDVVRSGQIGSGRLFISKKDKADIFENMELLGIAELAKRSFAELSGGQKQKVLLARALCATKKLILLDEPTASLDPDAAEELYRLIERINKERRITVIMVTHDMHSVDYATHVLHMGKDNIFTTRDGYVRRFG
ncbi:MAG: metal ABC transporter ATP-binding protein [Clostridia bacterium]|nr:metal ABC transporter ATP-binding protein [Clostridia bacterium]